MSQVYKPATAGNLPGTVVETLTGNDSIAVPATNHNINVVGTGAVNVTGNAGTSTLTISVADSGFVWSDVSGSFSFAKPDGLGVFVFATATGTLPSSPTQGNTLKFVVDTGNILTVQANTGQSIRVADQISSVAGTITSTAIGCTLELVYRASDSTWMAFVANGGWNLS